MKAEWRVEWWMKHDSICKQREEKYCSIKRHRKQRQKSWGTLGYMTFWNLGSSAWAAGLTLSFYTSSWWPDVDDVLHWCKAGGGQRCRVKYPPSYNQRRRINYQTGGKKTNNKITEHKHSFQHKRLRQVYPEESADSVRGQAVGCSCQ